MTENKRFTKYVPDSYGYTYITTIIDNEKNKQTGNIDEIVDMLNELNDKCEFLEIENESLEDGATKYAELYHESLKENEQLKKELKIYRGISTCSNCKYQNYDWFEDGDEFEICEKGNNNQQMEYNICKEWEEF